MPSIVAVVHVGEAPPLGGGLRPAVVGHLYGGAVSRLIVHEIAEDGSMERIPGGYAPDLEADPSYPVTDLLLATRRGSSAVAQRLDVLDTKVRANYGAGFREKTFDSDVARGSSDYGRHYEARSQLEAHPYEDRIAVGVRPDASRPSGRRCRRTCGDSTPPSTASTRRRSARNDRGPHRGREELARRGTARLRDGSEAGRVNRPADPYASDG